MCAGYEFFCKKKKVLTFFYFFSPFFSLPPFSFSSPFSFLLLFLSSFFLLTPSLVLYDCSYLTRNKYNLQFNFVFSWYTIKNIYAYGVPYTLHEINTIFNLILSLVDIYHQKYLRLRRAIHITRNKYNLQFNFVFSWYIIKNIYAYGEPYTFWK